MPATGKSPESGFVLCTRQLHGNTTVEQSWAATSRGGGLR
jgi:hypothetical protein